MNEQLTIDEIEVLDFMVTFSNPVGWWFNNGGSTFWQQHMEEFRNMWDKGYLANEGEYTHDSFRITDTGRKALAACKAQRDLVLFIAEFELRLSSAINKMEGMKKKHGGLNDGVLRGLQEADKIYRACKERIQNVE